MFLSAYRRGWLLPGRYMAYLRRQAESFFLRPTRRPAWWTRMLHGGSGRYRYTVICPCAQAAGALRGLVESLLKQRLDFRRHIRFICADKGSADGTAELMREYAARYPQNITYLPLPEGTDDMEAIRRALVLADTDWVLVAEAGAVLDTEALYRADRALQRHPAAAMAALHPVCRGAGGRYMSEPRSAPLFRRACMVREWRQQEETVLPCRLPGVLMRRSLLAEHADALFRSGAEPVAAGAQALLRVYLAAEAPVLYLGRAKYYGPASAADVTREQVLHHGFADVPEEYSAFPAARQLFLHYVLPQIRTLADAGRGLVFTEAEQQAAWEQWRRCGRFLTAEDLERCTRHGLNWFDRLGILHAWMGVPQTGGVAVVERYDERDDSVTIRLFAAEEAEIEPSHGSALRLKCVRHRLLGQCWVTEHLLTLPLADGGISLRCDGQPVRFACRVLGRPGETVMEFLHLQQSWIPGRSPEWLRGWNSRRELRLTAEDPHQDELLTRASLRAAFRPPSSCRDPRYRDCWVFMERLRMADDNAEHLYRYVAARYPQQPLYFVLHRESADWERLKREGFHLLAHGSAEHHAALRGCSVFLSSHIDREQINPFGDECLLTKKLVFLQHGVTKDDIHEWLNAYKFSAIVTTTQGEYQSIAAAETLYRYGAHEVLLTGFPRYDSLLALSGREKKQILIMPTWRLYLSGLSAEAFAASAYVQYWSAFLNSPVLQWAKEEMGYEVVFFPHPTVRLRAEYLAAFRLPSHVIIPPASVRYQQLFSECRICITDYTSAVFDAAFLQRCILYYQFDEEEFFSRHLTVPGYYAYRRDGFGPVLTTAQEMEQALRAAVEACGRPAPLYAERMVHTFPHRDGRNCERCYAAVNRLLKGCGTDAASRDRES